MVISHCQAMATKASLRRLARGRSRGVSSNPLLAPVFKYPMKMKKFGLSETKLFHFHGILKKNEENQLYMIPFPENLDPPLQSLHCLPT